MPMPTRLDELTTCPRCGRAIDATLTQFHRELESRIVRLLMHENAAWTREAGACPECVYEVAQFARVERSATSLHGELLLPFPVYSCEDVRLLPTPLRVHANPQFTGSGVTIAFLDSGFYPHADLTRPENRILRY